MKPTGRYFIKLYENLQAQMQQDDEFYFLAGKDDLPKLCYNKGYFISLFGACDVKSEKIPHVLMILDGIGHREETKDNAVAVANTPNLDALSASYPNGLISGSGMDVGLPGRPVGNSKWGIEFGGCWAYFISRFNPNYE